MVYEVPPRLTRTPCMGRLPELHQAAVLACMIGTEDGAARGENVARCAWIVAGVTRSKAGELSSYKLARETAVGPILTQSDP